MQTQCCRTCRYLGLPTDKRGRLYVPRNRGFACLAPDPVLPPMPISITKAYGFQWPKTRKWMQADEGEDCPTYESRTSAQARG